MDRTRRLLIAILVVVLIGLIAVIAGALFVGHDGELTQGNKNILVCAIDEGESRPGMGACDMAFIINLENGTLKNYTPFYPGDMTHPTAAEPEEAQEQGAGSALLLHDAFWDADNEKGLQYAKEIVEYRTNTKIDSVVAINSQALDAILAAAGPMEINGEITNASGIDIIREDDWSGEVSRADAVMNVVKAAAKAASNNPNVKSAMVQAAFDQYSKGNIIMDDQGDFAGLLASKGFEAIF